MLEHVVGVSGGLSILPVWKRGLSMLAVARVG